MTKRKVSHSSMARLIASGKTSASAMVSVSSHTSLPRAASASQSRRTKSVSRREYETKRSAMPGAYRGGAGASRRGRRRTVPRRSGGPGGGARDGCVHRRFRPLVATSKLPGHLSQSPGVGEMVYQRCAQGGADAVPFGPCPQWTTLGDPTPNPDRAAEWLEMVRREERRGELLCRVRHREPGPGAAPRGRGPCLPCGPGAGEDRVDLRGGAPVRRAATSPMSTPRTSPPCGRGS